MLVVNFKIHANFEYIELNRITAFHKKALPELCQSKRQSKANKFDLEQQEVLPFRLENAYIREK